MSRWTRVVAGVLVWLGGCTSTSVIEAMAGPTTLQVEVVGFEGCPNTPEVLYRVQLAAAGMEGDVQVIYVDQATLGASDARRLWGAPTVLVQASDLMGTQPNSTFGLSCRVYPDGLPDVDDLTARLQSAAR